MNFVDSHCHLDFAQFDSDRAQLIQECRRVNIQSLVIPGVEPAQWQTLRDLAQHHDMLRYGVGVHPWWIERCIDDLLVDVNSQHTIDQWLEKKSAQLISDPGCVAIGESGLDGNIDLPIAQQVLWLKAHIRLANHCKKPLIIHCVKAHNPLIEVLNEMPLNCGGVVHAFSGSSELAEQYIARGLMIGVGGTITYPRANKTRNAVAKLPLSRLLLETDAPDMPLNGYQGQRNSPLHLIDVAKTLAELKSVMLNDIAEQTTNNARQLFSLPELVPLPK